MSNMIELIKVLRERTGAGLMDCKKALIECNEDVEKAIDWLREKGIAKVAKKAGRIAAEGLTTVKSEYDSAVILEVNSETDFVAKSDAFKTLVNQTADVILAKKPGCINCAREALNEIYTEATIKIGEKLELRRFELLSKNDNQTFGCYIHMGGKISVLLLIEGKLAQEDADNLAMHVAANAPLYITREDIPQEEIEKETAIQLEKAREDEKLKGKPEEMIKKIIAGKVSKYFSESVLVEQEYLMEAGVKVGNFLNSKGVKLIKMIRFMTGEGLSKREENFAEEVAKQAA